MTTAHLHLRSLLILAAAAVATGCDGQDPVDATQDEAVPDDILDDEGDTDGGDTDGEATNESRTSPGGGVFRQTASPANLVDCNTVDIQPTGPSLVFNNPSLLASGFGLGRTLDQIVASTPNGSGTASAVSLLQDLTASYDDTVRTQLAAGLDLPVDQRPGERDLDEPTMLIDITPVALFNRFDLAPADGSDCGEYRIVYAKTGPTLTFGRFTMIFEARYPNPSPELGREGCRPIADFWASLSETSLTDADRVGMLEAFYYDGIQHEGVSLPPVVDFVNYAPGGGQIRTNNFINFVKWQLREFRTDAAGGETRLVVDTVKDQPLAELFDEAFVPGPPFDPAGFDGLRSDFLADFTANQVSLLARPEQLGLTDALNVVNGFGAAFDERFFEFQGDSQGLLDDPDAHAGPGLRSAIDGELSATGLDATLDAQVILNRAGTLTCGGCHSFSAGRTVGAGPDGTLGTADDIRWPSDLGFVHVDESGNLSPALQDSFLPARQLILEDFVCNPPAPATGFQMGRASITATFNPAAWTQVTFDAPFNSVPAVFINANEQGGQPCHTRVRNVTSTGFEVTCVEPVPLDGGHVAMDVGYVAAEAGSFDAGGLSGEVACADVSALRSGVGAVAQSWQNVNFGTSFAVPPVMLAQIQSDTNGGLRPAGEPVDTWMTAAVRNVTSTGFQTALDLAEVTPPSAVGSEEICYLAMDRGPFITSDGVACEANSSDVFQGWDNPCEVTQYTQQFASAPIAVGSMMSRDGGNGGWARQCSQTASTVGYRIDEDQANDSERFHVPEVVGFLACEAPVTAL